MRSLALVGHQGLGHIGVSKWREELQETDIPISSEQIKIVCNLIFPHVNLSTLVTLTSFWHTFDARLIL